MSTGYNRMTRRQFLRGSGAILALPLLPSLLPRNAMAQMVAPKRILFAHYDHNLPLSRWMDPALAVTPVGAHGARELILSTYSGSIGPAMTHATINSLKAAGKITVLRGIDNIIAHAGHGSYHLTGSMGIADHSCPMFPSIDTIFESSTKIYPAGTPSYVRKVIRCNGSSSFKKTGSNITSVPGYENPVQLYNDLFGNFPNPGGGTPQPPSGPLLHQSSVLNKVFQAYQSARSSRRISNDDRLRLEEHMTLVSEVEQAVRELATPPPVAACTVPPTPANPGTYAQRMELYLKLITAAFKCGVTKVGTIHFDSHTITGSHIPGLPEGHHLHGDVFHEERATYTTEQMAVHHTTWFKWMMDMLSQHILGPLSVEEPGTGRTYLDNMIVAVLGESGMAEEPGYHTNHDYQPILFGSMGGYLRTDRFVAFRRHDSTIQYDSRKYGIPYNQLLITFLQAMGLQNADYRQDGVDGFGPYRPYLNPAWASNDYRVADYNYVMQRLPVFQNFYGNRFTLPIAEIVQG